MRKYSINKNILLSWLWVMLCSFAIFALIPLGNRIQKFISNYLGKMFFIYFILIVLGFVLIGLIYLLNYRYKIRSLQNYIWLLALTGLYIYFILKMRNSPVEVTHFLEYGLLSIFIFRALNHHVKDKTIYLSAAFIILLIGTLDEIIQWLVPGRLWNFKDVKLNIISGLLIQLAIWKIVRPKLISEKINPKSIRIFTYLFASCLLTLGLCISNTPQRVYNYTRKIPWLSYLQKEEPMSEYGYRYNDPEIGIFYSRMKPAKLRKIDDQRGKECAQILNESANMDYGQFIKKYNPIFNPFLYELRIHIFRRDTYLGKARATSKFKEKKECYFIAYKENIILKKYFTQSIEKSVYRWDEDILNESGESIDKSKSYESAVSSDLFTAFSEKTMWISIIGLISFLALANLTLAFIKKSNSNL